MAEFSDFRTCIDEASEDYSLLRSHRIHAAREAYCRQASLHCSRVSHWSSAIRHELVSPILASGNATGLTNECSWVCSVEASDPHSPQTLDRGPRIAACPWLEDKNEDPFGLGGWPEYLWHLQNRCLV